MAADKEALWQVFGHDIKKLPKCRRGRFAHSVTTDGYGISIHITCPGNDQVGLDEDDDDIIEDEFDKCIKLSQK